MNFETKRAHPWHGVQMGPQSPDCVRVYVEIVPTDTVKYELDKSSGILSIDRPQKYSNHCPALYGFVPQTYCGSEIGKLAETKLSKKLKGGDQDPLDILVLCETYIPRGDILLWARPIGGICMIDDNEADDKIIAVLVDDLAYGKMTQINDLPETMLNRIRHYFLTYKQIPGDQSRGTVDLARIYDRAEACQVIQTSHQDYLSLIKR